MHRALPQPIACFLRQDDPVLHLGPFLPREERLYHANRIRSMVAELGRKWECSLDGHDHKCARKHGVTTSMTTILNQQVISVWINQPLLYQQKVQMYILRF